MRAIEVRLTRAQARLGPVEAQLRQLSPLRVLERGYAIVQTEGGTVVKTPADAPPGTQIRARLAAGEITARVEET